MEKYPFFAWRRFIRTVAILPGAFPAVPRRLAIPPALLHPTFAIAILVVGPRVAVAIASCWYPRGFGGKDLVHVAGKGGFVPPFVGTQADV